MNTLGPPPRAEAKASHCGTSMISLIRSTG